MLLGCWLQQRPSTLLGSGCTLCRLRVFCLAHGGICLPIRLRDPEASLMARLAGTNRIGDSLSYLGDLDAPVAAEAEMFFEAFVDNGPTVRVALPLGALVAPAL